MVVITDLHFPSTLSVGTSVVEVVPEKTTRQRTVIVITNTSTLNQRISIGIGQDAVDGVGLVLYAGSTYTENIDAAFTPTNARITAIASAAGGSISIYERSV